LAERYSSHLTDLVRHQPDQSSEKILDVLQPSLKDAVHWEPAITALGLGQSDSFVWRREHGEIQSYQQASEPRGWLHIDSAGQFMDRGANVIPAEQALGSLGLTASEMLSHGRGEGKDTPQNAGFGMSMSTAMRA
jgi:hypothetical protein